MRPDDFPNVYDNVYTGYVDMTELNRNIITANVTRGTGALTGNGI
jgi:hypothetical protein